MILLAPKQTFHGPNPYAHVPVTVWELRAGQFAFDAARTYATLHSYYPAWLDEAGPVRTKPSLFNDPELALATIAVHWALGALNEVRGFLQACGAKRSSDAVQLWLGFHNPAVSAAALQLALQVVAETAQGVFDPANADRRLAQLWQACRQHHPDYQARILMVGAQQRGIPTLPFLPATKFWQFGWGANGRTFLESASNADGYLGGLWQRNKATTKRLFQVLGVPTPAHILISNAEEMEAAIQQVGYPCVLKPLSGSGGKGVTANIREPATLHEAFAHASSQGTGPIMLEAHAPGDDHRLMIVEGRLVAAIRREPSYVLGDGQSTVAELANRLNASRSPNIVKSRYLRPITLDKVLADHLVTQGVALETVLPAGRRVTLRSNANLSTGGLCTDVTDQLDPQVRAMAEQLALNLGLQTAGLDYLTTDISRSPADTGGVFIELNTIPSLDVCIAAGWTEEAIADLVLGKAVGPIPVDLVVVPTAMLPEWRKTLSTHSHKPDEGWVCGEDICVEGVLMHYHADEPWGAVRAALRNRSLHRLQIVCTTEDILRQGLPLDRFANITLDRTQLPEEWHPIIAEALPHSN
jgi:cyanophycin synthetase